MKKLLSIMMSITILQACSNNGGQTGVQNDGMKLGDTNGGRADTLVTSDQSATDTSKGEHRVDISNRDTFQNDQRQP